MDPLLDPVEADPGTAVVMTLRAQEVLDQHGAALFQALAREHARVQAPLAGHGTSVPPDPCKMRGFRRRFAREVNGPQGATQWPEVRQVPQLFSQRSVVDPPLVIA